MRLEGWEGRIASVIEAARRKPYAIGEHDCFRLTCIVIEALTGEDRWPEFAGRYASRRESMHLLAQYGRTFDTAFDWFFGGAHLPMSQARRGDAAKYTDVEPHLGIVTGSQVAVLGDRGLVSVPLSDCEHCWRIG